LERLSAKPGGLGVMPITYDGNMPLSLKGENLTRYKNIAGLFMKYGRGDLVKGAGMADLIEDAQVSDPVATKSGLEMDYFAASRAKEWCYVKYLAKKRDERS
jgi:hypothetical protein